MKQHKAQRTALQKRWVAVLTGMYLLATSPAWAIENGGIETTSGAPHLYNIDLSTMNVKNNRVGETIVMPFKLNGAYSVFVHCAQTLSSTRYYTATTMMVPSETPGFLKLNDYFDVRVKIFVVNSGDVTAPFYGVDNQAQETCHAPTQVETNTQTGSRGEVTFMITKPLINGISLQGHELVKLYGRLGSPVGIRENPLAVVSIHSGVITSPDTCKINNGGPITVDFEDIPGASSKLNGSQYKKDINIEVACTGGSFETGDLNISLAIQPAGSGVASFNHDYLGTTGTADRSDLGIALTKKDGSLVQPNTFYAIDNFSNNKGSWKIMAAPVARPGSHIPEGEFDASASIVAEFQ